MIVYHTHVYDDEGRTHYYIETSAARVPVVGDQLEVWPYGEWLHVHAVVLGLTGEAPTHVWLANIAPVEKNRPAAEWVMAMEAAGWRVIEKGRGQ